MKLNINEIFSSIQGEGIYAGVPMTFIRLQGCPFRCNWCDTKDSWEFGIGEKRTVEGVLSQVEHLGNKWICITGGEPLSQPKKFDALVGALHRGGFSIEVETSGLVPLPWRWNESDSFNQVESWIPDVKCPSSGEEGKNYLENLSFLRKSDQLKFVVGDNKDLGYAYDILNRYETKAHILLSPVYGVPQEWLQDSYVNFIQDLARRGKNIRASFQMHKNIWGEKRGV